MLITCLWYVHEFRLHGFQEADRLGGDHVYQRTALGAGEDRFIDGRAVLLLREDDAGARSAQGLVSGGRHDVGIFAGIGVQAGGNQSGEMRHVDQQDRAHGIADFAEALEVPGTRIGAAAGDDHFGLVLFGEARHAFEIDALVFLARLVRHHVVGLAGEVELVAVSQVAAVVEVEAHDDVAGRQHRGISRLVGLRTGVRLHVDVLGVEELFGAIASQVFDHVGEFATAVVALGGIAFGVLIGKDAAGGFQNRFRDEVLAGDQLDLRMLPLGFPADRIIDFGVNLRERTGHRFKHRVYSNFSSVPLPPAGRQLSSVN